MIRNAHREFRMGTNPGAHGKMERLSQLVPSQHRRSALTLVFACWVCLTAAGQAMAERDEQRVAAFGVRFLKVWVGSSLRGVLGEWREVVLGEKRAALALRDERRQHAMSQRMFAMWNG